MADRLRGLQAVYEQGDDGTVIDFARLFGPAYPFTVRRGETVLMIGDTGIAKSCFFENVAVLLGRGVGHHPVRRVFDCQFEMPGQDVMERYLQIAHGLRVGVADGVVYNEVQEALIQANAPAYAERLLKPIEHIDYVDVSHGSMTVQQIGQRALAHGADVVIIDTLEGVAPPPRTSKSEVAAQVAVVEDLARMAVEIGVAVLIVHHINKAGQRASERPRRGETVSDVPDLSDAKGIKAFVEKPRFVLAFGGERSSSIRKLVLRKRGRNQVLGPVWDGAPLGELRLKGDPLTLRFFPFIIPAPAGQPSSPHV